jgi:hypothetical protein
MGNMSEECVIAEEKKSQKAAPRRSYTPYTALTLDADFCVCSYGDAATSLFGYAEVSIIGKPISRILPALACRLEKSPAKRPTPIRLNEVRMDAMHADGNSFPVMVGLRQDYLHGTCRHLVLIRNLVERSQA